MDLRAALDDLRRDPESHLPRLFEAGGYTPSATAYFEHYGLVVPEATHYFGAFDQGSYRLAAHVFEPRTPRGTVLVLHGYLDHAGLHSRLARRLAAVGFTVALFDLPGHGLSSGERAAIEDFDDYVDALAAFFGLCRERSSAPYHLVGHSTGAAVMLDGVLNRRLAEADRYVLVAPLVRSHAWRLSAFGQWLGGLVLRRVPRVFRNNSSDREFLRFVRRDPLQTRRLPLRWHRALRRWNERIAAATPVDQEVLVLQGTADTTVDWRYNGPFLRRKLPRVRVERIEDGRHHLLNEASPIRDRVLELVESYLG